MRLFGIRDEKLGLVRIGSGIGHGYDSACIELQIQAVNLYGIRCQSGLNTLRVDRSSSAKVSPQMLWPPFPEPEGSPV